MSVLGNWRENLFLRCIVFTPTSIVLISYSTDQVQSYNSSTFPFFSHLHEYMKFCWVGSEWATLCWKARVIQTNTFEPRKRRSHSRLLNQWKQHIELSSEFLPVSSLWCKFTVNRNQQSEPQGSVLAITQNFLSKEIDLNHRLFLANNFSLCTISCNWATCSCLNCAR